MSATVRAGTLAVLLCATTGAAHAETKPLWEAGIGIGVLGFNDYRGADTAHAYPLPVPYLVYRGERLRADRDGVRGRLFDQDVVELNLSIGATTPVRSRDTSARAGMADLRPTVEVGPSLDLHLWRSAARGARLDLRLPVRAAFTVEHAPRALGAYVAPHLNLDLRHPVADGWAVGLLAGPLFAERRYDAYFYDVAGVEATARRPAFRARGGYAGAQSVLALSRRFRGLWVGAFARYDRLDGAEFAASPLVRRHDYWAAGVGVAWLVGQSARTVEVEEWSL